MRKNFYLNFIIFQAIIITLSSCINQKQIAYFQKGNQSDTIQVAQAFVPKIQPGDILAINIESLNPMASSFFNPTSSMPSTENAVGTAVAGGGGGGAGTAPVSTSAPGFLVDSAGTIELPLVGIIKVAGLNTSQAREVIKSRIKEYLKEPTVNVRFLNYKIAVMGEVTRPSVYVIPNEQVTLPEALSIAGDLTIYGKRDNILIVRDVDGKKVFGHVNLNSREVFSSPYYYLHSGDLIYVEQGKGKIAGSDVSFRILPIIISTLALMTLIYYRFK